jgi:hypothetical protein
MFPEGGRAEERAKLARVPHDTSPIGRVLTDEDRVGRSFDVIVEGRAAVSVCGRPARILGLEYFGGMALIDHSRL